MAVRDARSSVRDDLREKPRRCLNATLFPLRVAEQHSDAGRFRRGLSEPSRICDGEFRSRPASRAAQGSPKDRRTGGSCDPLAAGSFAGTAASAPFNFCIHSCGAPPAPALRDTASGRSFSLLTFSWPRKRK